MRGTVRQQTFRVGGGVVTVGPNTSPPSGNNSLLTLGVGNWKQWPFCASVIAPWRLQVAGRRLASMVYPSRPPAIARPVYLCRL